MATDATRASQQAMFVEYRRSRDRALRNRIIESHRPLAVHIAQSFAQRGEPFDDLLQVAQLGMLKAVERFEPEQNFAFSTFATATIRGEIKRHFRDRTWAVRVPRRAKELHLALAAMIPVLSQELGRAPSVSQLAAAMQITEDEVFQAMEAGNAYRSSSLDAGRSGEDGEGSALVDRLGELDRGIHDTEERLVVDDLLASLSERERRIVELRFFDGLTQSEIAVEVGVSQMHVSRLLARTLLALRSRLARDDV